MGRFASSSRYALEAVFLAAGIILLFLTLARWELLEDGVGIKFLVEKFGSTFTRIVLGVISLTTMALAIHSIK